MHGRQRWEHCLQGGTNGGGTSAPGGDGGVAGSGEGGGACAGGARCGGGGAAAGAASQAGAGGAAAAGGGTAGTSGSSAGGTPGVGGSAGSTASQGGTAGSSSGVCGDGVVDPGEDCDDANTVDADGCNRDCVQSGKVLWTWERNGTQALGDTALDVAIDRDGNVIVVGALTVMPGGIDAAIWKLDAEGHLLDELILDNPLGDDRISGVAVDADNQLVVIGTRALPETEGGTVEERVWYGVYDAADLGEVWSTTLPGRVGRGTAVTLDAQGDVYLAASVVGPNTGYRRLWLRRLDGSTNAPLWTHDEDPLTVSSCDALVDVAYHLAVHPAGDLVAPVANYCGDTPNQTDCRIYLEMVTLNDGVSDLPNTGCQSWASSAPTSGLPAQGGVAVGADATVYVAVTSGNYTLIATVPADLHDSTSGICGAADTLMGGPGAGLQGRPVDLAFDRRWDLVSLTSLGTVSKADVDTATYRYHVRAFADGAPQALTTDRANYIYVVGQSLTNQTPDVQNAIVAKLAP